MSPWGGVLAMTMVVRDEEEILATNLRHHLGEGVDIVLVLDHGSSDGTPQILTEFEATGRVRVFRDDQERGFHQAARVRRLLAIARDEHAADWVIHGDADEFWMPAAGSLRDVLAAVPDRYGYALVPRHDFVPLTDGDGPFQDRMIFRPVQSFTPSGKPLPPKVVQRPAAGDGLVPGNHNLLAAVLPAAPDIRALEILHFPMRSYAQFEHKVLRSGEGHEAEVNRAATTAYDQMQQLDAYRRGELEQHWRRRALDAEAIAGAVAAGRLIEDARLRDRLAAMTPASAAASAPDPGAVELPWVQAMLREVWARESAAADARAALETDLVQAREQAARLRTTLDAINASRLMRYTTAPRRLYYRWRGATSQ